MFIKSKLTERELLEQLSEEASELAQASLKLIRAKKLSNNNTPVSCKDALSNLKEEMEDVRLCYEILTSNEVFSAVRNIDIYYKLKRWAKRLGYEDE